jgi:cysteine desulfurase
MEKVYLDNASTTAIRPEVIVEMAAVMGETYGNPSSTHSFGRAAKSVLEAARKAIASQIGAEAREIIFTSGGTEADNLILRSAVQYLGVQRIISSRTEHHAVLNTATLLHSEAGVRLDYVKLTSCGLPDMDHLEELLQEGISSVVSLMHVNNETGVVADLVAIGNLCRKYGALFHSDTVQSIGKERFNMAELPVDFITASAHKFHGPKGVGFLYIRKGLMLKPLITGGEQEKGLRAGTEAVHQVAGMAKALEISYLNLDTEKRHIESIRNYCLSQLKLHLPGFSINGWGEDVTLFYNIINVLLPLPEDKTAMILFALDMKGIAVSRGSACQSGSIRPSHVLSEILPKEHILRPSLRISFSHSNTPEDIDRLIDALKQL